MTRHDYIDAELRGLDDLEQLREGLANLQAACSPDTPAVVTFSEAAKAIDWPEGILHFACMRGMFASVPEGIPWREFCELRKERPKIPHELAAEFAGIKFSEPEPSQKPVKAPKLAKMLNVQIARVGKWNNIDFTPKLLASLYDNFHATKLQRTVPVTLGHGHLEGGRFVEREKIVRDEDGLIVDISREKGPVREPTAGHVRRLLLSKDRSELHADLWGIPVAVAEQVAAGHLSNVSIELSPCHRYLGAVALLGVSKPGIHRMSELPQPIFE